MTYTSHGAMSVEDMADYRESYDLDAWKDAYQAECPGHEAVTLEEPMGTVVFCRKEDDECLEA